MLIEPGPDGLTYERCADASDDFHSAWDTIGAAADMPMTQQKIRAAWPLGLPKPHIATLWRWLDCGVTLGLACRTGQGTKNDPYRYEAALPE